MMSVKDAIKNRFSVRAFTDQEVPKDVISNIINLAKCAPSGVNSQPWKVYVPVSYTHLTLPTILLV